ncbi:hypothetical protein C1I98_35155 [Spongiactinospora gelatinilytica]|uniref:Uncharacterized protein n=1 Tax=Spongiactinospora gelatinilytica TaxID=2666298 RepID=A0A2W2EKJ8_9ACTN|nr:hypothetical protein [Spongiactinospora gelatinilytica]PZG24866.1 hypothetical protein C1I98_35155 [Spongiactinospora gelatinilytica]
MTATPIPLTPASRGTPLAVTIASWAVPVMIVGQFAMLASVPVAVALVGALVRVRDRAVRPAAMLLAATYAIPLTIWLARPDGAPNLSKDMHPGLAALIVAASAVLIVTVHRAGRR